MGPTGQVRVAPGEAVSLSLKGWIWNNNRDTCIQQCGLALGTDCIGELYNGVPSNPTCFLRTVTIKAAPRDPGAYPLYRFGDLQYSFRDALRNFHNRTQRVTANYPESFVGWLIVENDA